MRDSSIGVFSALLGEVVGEGNKMAVQAWIKNKLSEQ